MKKKLIDYASFQPASLTFSNAWAGHLPFAAWLINEIAPKTFVELGTYSGNSYFSFCQSVLENSLSTKCYAVDTWVGDEHGGVYTEKVFDYVNTRNQNVYAAFSRLLRMTFDEAVDNFSDESINLLHIDGLHTYEAVRHDFETWQPKLAPDAIVLFHDINVRENGFGVWKLWEELQSRYPLTLEFLHSHGLGVLALDEQSAKSYPWLIPGSHRQEELKSFFPAIGGRQIERFELAELKRILCERDADLSRAAIERDELVADLSRAAIERDEHAAGLDQKINEQQKTIDGFSIVIADQTRQLADHKDRLERVISSRSWLITKPLRFMGRLLRGENRLFPSSQDWGGGIFRRGRNALRYIVKGDFKGLYQRAGTIIDESTIAFIEKTVQKTRNKTYWGILATGHTLFIADLISHRLKKLGFQAEIITEPSRDFPLDWYIVVCPQMFHSLPPSEKRFAFQMEQSVSSRWFTSRYFATLKASLAVLEYSLTNIDFLASKGVGYPHVHYLPVGALTHYGEAVLPQEKRFDILFYGDCNSSSRRRKMLDVLKKHYNVQVVSEVFGLEMQKTIKQARLVINLHYYENALLEMPRIQECLSLGVPVVSESAQDQNDYPELAGAVIYFEQGSIDGMLEAVEEVLNRPSLTQEIDLSITQSQQRFSFMFDRFLVAMGFLPTVHVQEMVLPPILSNDYVALSLPETIFRRREFEAVRPQDCVIFDGMRRQPGWVGCGLSYQALAQNALRCGLRRLAVMEDDVVLPDGFEAKMTVINEFLDERSAQWDIFSGLIASLHDDVKILAVEEYKGMMFVTINKMVSMVFNVYSEKALRVLSTWDAEWLDAEKNTIDRYLENQVGLRVVVVLPFLVGHREEVDSTLWGFQNTTYLDMIATSEKTLRSMVSDHKTTLIS